MRLVPFKEIFLEKLNHEKTVPGLEYHMMKDCVHIGKISLSCENCFLQNHHESFAVYAGEYCDLQCPMCYYDRERKDEIHTKSSQIENQLLRNLFAKSLDPYFRPKYIAFNSNGESLMYMHNFQRFAEIINRIEDEKQIKIYKHIYTNGLLADKKHLQMLKNWRIDEIRFHVTASQSSDKIFDNMRLAKSMGFIITVEEPSWPVHRDELMYFLKIFNDIGISHLNMIEVQITVYNFKEIDKIYPNGRYYKNALHHLYDEGLVYDIMREVSGKYSFSVLDCNSDVEKYRRVNLNLAQDNMLMRGACEEINPHISQ